jgi:hypothetical protein
MVTAIIIMVSVMAFTAVCMMFIAMAEFVLYMRSSRKNPQPTVMVAAPAPQPEPAPIPEPVKAEEPEVAVAEEAPTDENSVTFEVAQAQRQTLKEAYDALEKVYKEFYDKILAAANGLEMARIIESTYAVTVMQGRDNVGRLRILRGVVTLDCTVINPDLVKYNKENGWIHVSLNVDNTYFFIKVEDSGIGIPEEDIDRIFERFFRVDKSHSREIGGTGLGLAITRQAVLMHHGAIRVYSREGEGTTFTVRIPLRYSEQEQGEI